MKYVIPLADAVTTGPVVHIHVDAITTATPVPSEAAEPPAQEAGALAVLLDAVRAGRAHGDDASLRAAWDAETVPGVLVLLLAAVAMRRDRGSSARWVGALNAAARACHRARAEGHVDSPCAACSRAIRAAVPCPTRSAVMGLPQ